MPLPRRLSEPGPILTYLASIRVQHRAVHDQTVAAIQDMLRSPVGNILLDLLEKSITLRLEKSLDDDRALLARNAQGFIAADLRRMASDELAQMARQDAAASAGSAGRKPSPGTRRRAG